MSIIQGSAHTSAGGGGYQVANSLRFNSADTAYLNRTPASAGNRKTFTWSGWVKRGALSSSASYFLFAAGSFAGSTNTSFRILNDSINIYWGGTGGPQWTATAVLRDPSAWYHLVFAFDTTQATLGNRLKLYVNGVQSAVWSLQESTGLTAQNSDLYINNNQQHNLGASGTPGNYFDGYMTEINFVDGQALTPSSFGETDSATGVWKPKAYSGTYGTNGFYLPFKTASQWSGYFDGTGDYLTVANNAALNFGTSAFTVECWFYRTSSAAVYGLWSLNSVTSGYAGARAQINTNGSIDIYISQNGSSWANSITNLGSTTVNTWNHLAVVRESNGNIKIYINGTQAGTTVTNANSLYAGTSHLIGGVYSAGSPSSVFPGYISNLRSVVGTAVYTGNFTPPTSQLTAVTNTQLLTCQSSTFVDNSTNALTITAAGDSRPQQFSPFTLDVTDDHSGQGNHWQPNNLDLRTTGVGADILVDTPTNYGTDTGVGGEVRGNYCTWNSVDNLNSVTLSNGNLQVTGNGTTARGIRGTLSLGGSTPFYFEYTNTTNFNINYPMVGICAIDEKLGTGANDSATGPGKVIVLYPNGANWGAYSNGSLVTSGTATAYSTNGSIVMFAWDPSTGKFWMGVGGTWHNSGNPAAGTNPTGTISSFIGLNMTPTVSTYSTSDGFLNCGQRPFAYTAPSGFKALCTQNLPTPTIGATSTTQANDYFNAVLYTGNGSSQSITGVGFQPDFTWIKSRSAATDHALYDAVRGVQLDLVSNSTAAETTQSTGLTAFNSDGFTIGSLAKLNTNTATYVAWGWDANGAGSTNTAGTITSTVSANTTSGCSIVTYTGNNTSGATVGHGLGVKPAFIIVKKRTGTDGWGIYHTSLGATKTMELNTTAAEAASAIPWNNTEPTSSVIYLNGNNYANSSSYTYVMYVFAAVSGYSAFGSFTGNGNANGPFVYLGFRPAFVMAKLSSAIGDWNIVDDMRQTYNDASGNPVLRANLSSAEEDVDTMQGQMDLLSNGFKLRSNNSSLNLNNGTIIYAAFAENPFKYSLAR